MAKKQKAEKKVETLTHPEAKRKNIPTAEHRSVLNAEEAAPQTLKYPRNTDLDPQLVWRGKDEQDWSDLVVQAPPLYIQEKIHPKVLIDDLLQQSKLARAQEPGEQIDLFADFNGMPQDVDRTEFYQHEQNWSNRMILGDSLQVMASLAEREGLRGRVQCIYIDPPYGIKFNSNFQWSTTSRDVKDGNPSHITREPEQVKAFRDTWRDGIHSYLTYLRDRLAVARDLLTDSGSIFVQIGDKNVHRVRALMDEILGDDNFVSLISFTKTEGLSDKSFSNVSDFILWYAKQKKINNQLNLKYRDLKSSKEPGEAGATGYILIEDYAKTHWRTATKPEIDEGKVEGYEFFDDQPLISQDEIEGGQEPFPFQGDIYRPAIGRHWSTGKDNSKLHRIARANRIIQRGERIEWKRYISETSGTPLNNVWLGMGERGFAGAKKIYVVETAPEVIRRCILMTTDPGDLVIDPTCGSGTTAYAAEQWGRRWITIDTSRVALALARARIMGARYPYYLLTDSKDGQEKEAEVSGRAYVEKPAYNNVRHGFVYERVPHITLKSIANNAEIDVIYENWQPKVQDALARLNAALRNHNRTYRVTTGGREGKDVSFNASENATFTMPSGEVVKAYELLEWEVPREAPSDWPKTAQQPLADFWTARIGRQKEIDASISAKAEFEKLYDKPYDDKKKVRVAGPFTVESLSPHRMLGVDENDELIDPLQVGEQGADYNPVRTFVQMILDNLKNAGVQQAHREDRISFTSLTPWPGKMICAEGRYLEGDKERRAAIFIGPEFGTVSRPDLVEAAREAGDAGFDLLIGCAFNYEAHASEFNKLGRIPVLKARMNAELHMAADLKNTGKGNLFVIFGEPDIEILPDADSKLRVRVRGVDVFDPTTGEVRSDSADGIACWLIDTDYNAESFFVRHAYFLGQNDPYGALKTTLKAEINADAWSTLHSDTSRPFDKPKSGRIAVKVINHLGDEVMKVFKV